MKPAILALVAAATLAACTDDPAPAATIASVTPDQLVASDDTRNDVTLALRYDDHDGDLGGGVAEVHDCRSDAIAIALPIPAIAAEPHQHITGRLELHVNDIAAIAPGAAPAVCHDHGAAPPAGDQVAFCVVLVDAAGHRGAAACTAPIPIAP
jgi:hypothetical protein